MTVNLEEETSTILSLENIGNAVKGTVDLQECLPENRSYEHRLR